MPMYEVLAQRIYLVRTREETTFFVEASSPQGARERATSFAWLDRSDSATPWEILRAKEDIKAVQVCRVKRITDAPRRPLPFRTRLRLAFGLT